MSIFVTGGAGFIGTNFLFNWFADTNEKLINIDPNIKFTEIPLPDTIIRKNQPICLAHRKVRDIGSLKKEYHNILEKINNI